MIASSPLEEGLFWPHIKRDYLYYFQVSMLLLLLMLYTFIKLPLGLCIYFFVHPSPFQNSTILICKAKCLQHSRLCNIVLTLTTPNVFFPCISALAVGSVTYLTPKLEILTPSPPLPFTSNWPLSPKHFTSSVYLKACCLLTHPAYLFIIFWLLSMLFPWENHHTRQVEENMAMSLSCLNSSVPPCCLQDKS